MDICHHDGFFKALMDQPGTAGVLLRERLPQPVTALLAPGEPELVEGSFIDEELRETRSDRLYRVGLRGGDSGYIYCLLEHKSTPDPRVALQLLRYIVRIWDRFDRDARGRGLLPAVIPLVVYHGAEPWKAPSRFVDMVASSDTLKLHLLDFPFGVVDVGRIDDVELSRDSRLRAGLLVLKYAMIAMPDERWQGVIAGVFAELRSMPQEFLEAVLRYMIRAYGYVDERGLAQALKRAMPEKEKQMLSIAAREWLDQGRREGRDEGRREGRDVGRREGEVRALLRVLERRFGSVPHECEEAIGKASIAQIELWLDRAIEARSMSEVLSSLLAPEV